MSRVCKHGKGRIPLPKLIRVFIEAVRVSGRRSGALPRGVPEARVTRVGRGEGTWEHSGTRAGPAAAGALHRRDRVC